VLLVTYLGLITAAAGVLAWLQRRITRRYQEAG